jgi:hypothetical protein
MFPAMRGHDYQQSVTYSYLSPEERVLVNHPLRSIRKMADRVLKKLSRKFKRDVRGHGTAVDSAREVVTSPVIALSIYSPQ